MNRILPDGTRERNQRLRIGDKGDGILLVICRLERDHRLLSNLTRSKT